MTEDQVISIFRDPPPLIEPVLDVLYGHHDDDEGFVFQGDVQSSTERNIVREAAMLAIRILLHPRNVRILSSILACDANASQDLVQHAVVYALHTSEWTIVLDATIDDAGFGHHDRPDDDDEDDAFQRIHINYEYVYVYRSLVEVMAGLEDGPAKEAQRIRSSMMLLYCGVGLAHEVCHALRGKLRELLAPFHIIIPQNTPPKLLTPFHSRETTDEEEEGESGWYLESEMMGGALQGCVRLQLRSKRGPQDVRESYESPVIAAFDFLALRVHNCEVQFAGEQGETLVAQLFDLYEIDSAWVVDTVNQFRAGRIDDVDFPPPLLRKLEDESRSSAYRVASRRRVAKSPLDSQGARKCNFHARRDQSQGH